MAKLSRSVLKGIVKECMVEIMSEAFFPMSNGQMQERLIESKNKAAAAREVQSSQYKSSPVATQNHSPRGSYLDNISFGSNPEPENKNFQSKVEKITNNMTSDPVLASIFKDTALTTLQEQASAERGGTTMPASRGDMAAKTVSANNPSDLFGSEAAGKWAQLAFSDNIRK